MQPVLAIETGIEPEYEDALQEAAWVNGWDRFLRVHGYHDWPRDPTQHGGAAYIVRMLEAYDTLNTGFVSRIILLDLVADNLVEQK